MKQSISFSQHPSALKFWLFSEFTERLCFFGIRALLTIMMIRSLQIDEEHAIMTMAMFTSYCYLTPVVGAIIADRWLPYESATLFGHLLITIGCLMIGLPGDTTLFWGLSFVITGTGFYKTNLITCVSRLYAPHDDHNRSNAFTIVYAVVDISLLIATGLLGWISRYSWHLTFIGLACFLILSFALLLHLTKFISHFSRQRFFSLKNLWIGIFAIGQIISFNALLLAPRTSRPILWLIFGIAFTYCAWITYRCASEDRKSVLIILFFSAISVIFLSFVEQMGYSVLLYIEHHVDRTVLGHMIPAPFFIALEPLGFILLFPLISKFLALCKKPPSIIIKFILAFLCLALGFGLLAMTTYPQSSEGNYYSIGLAIFLLTASQILVLPSILALTTRLAPKAITSLTVALFFISVAFATSLAGQISRTSLTSITIDGVQRAAHNYFNLFWWISVSSVLMAILLTCLKPIAKKYKWPI